MAGTVDPIEAPPYAFPITSRINTTRGRVPFSSALNKRRFRSNFERRVVKVAAKAEALAWYRPHSLYGRGQLYPAPTLLLGNGILVEALPGDGHWPIQNRLPLLAILNRHPGLDVRVVLENPEKIISDSMGSSYREWCDLKGIPWAHGEVPKGWIAEAPSASRIEAVNIAAWRAKPVKPEPTLAERCSLATRERQHHSQGQAGASPSLKTETNAEPQQ